MKQEGILLVLPVPFLFKGNHLYFESQACNGLERWADNFDSVVVAAPLMPEPVAEQKKTIDWRNTTTLANAKRFELVPLPWGYSLLGFLSYYNSVRTSLAALIARCRYLHFAIGGFFGDWAAVAALEAHKQGRPYVVHTDRVEHNVILQVTRGAKLITRMKARVIAPLMASYHKWIIENCALSLCHGNDCYSTYSAFCDSSYLIHDIHTKPSERINDVELSEKIKRASSDEVIHICYAGRIDSEKAPLDWVRALARARDSGVNLHATWMGDGALLAEMKAMIANLGMNSSIELLGFERNRDKVLKRIRESHFMLFTHVTPESPRCLLESLVCGTPIIGYQSRYSEDLVKDFGGGMFVPMKDWRQLGDLMTTLSKDRQHLSQLIKEAAENGTRFNDKAVFHERSELIKNNLP